jgi:hypothetical protein
MAHLAFRGRLYADQVSPRRLRGDEFHGQIFDRNQGKCGTKSGTKSFSTWDPNRLFARGDRERVGENQWSG